MCSAIMGSYKMRLWGYINERGLYLWGEVSQGQRKEVRDEF